MKRAGGGFDYNYNAFAAVDDQAHIIVAAELTNNAADSGQLVPLLEAVKDSTGELPAQLLADAGFRSEAQFEHLADTPVELIVALGREGKQQLAIDSAEYPRTAQMAAKLQTDRARSGLPSPQVALRAPQRLGEERAGLPSVQPAWIGQGQSRVAARLHCAESAQNGRHDVRLTENPSENSP